MIARVHIAALCFLVVIVGVLPHGFTPFSIADDQEPAKIVTLAGTQPLTWDGDLAARMVAGVDRFLLQQIEQSVAGRAEYWQADFSSPTDFSKSIEPNRRRLARMLGVRDWRVKFDAPELVATVGHSSLVARGGNFDVFSVRWPVLEDPDPSRRNVVVHGEGLLLVPRRADGSAAEPLAEIIAIPDADQTPEQICGLVEGVPVDTQFARRLAESGCRVIVPTLISRQMQRRTVPGRGPGANLTNREFIYRSAFELGRHLIGYEVQKVLACVDWFTHESIERDAKIGVIGYGEGGAIALYAGALDPRIDAVYASGYFGPREKIWNQPLDRNVFGLLREFGDAELAAMLSGRIFIADDAVQPAVKLPSEGGGPATIETFANSAVFGEFDRAKKLVPAKLTGKNFDCVTALNKSGPRYLQLDHLVMELAGVSELPATSKNAPQALHDNFDSAGRQQRQVDELDQFNQLLLRESPFVRKEFMAKLDVSSLAAYEKSVAPFRQTFHDDVIGRFEIELLPPAPRSRRKWETDKWIGYEVVLDLWPIGDEAAKQSGETVFAYGVLLVPKDLKRDGSERRPVVVCQHGLEGRPTDTFLNNHPAYHDFAAKLAERGFITFAPQNLYIGKDDFRTLQRKANPLGKTLFSIIVPQHQQIVDWLQSLPYVDPDRIAFYGLSYGGKTAMRVPALVTDYCLSICSADFNEWVLKNASTRHPFSYVWTGEYEIFEFDLGSTFNYAEMAALICPRPFMVERGHFDGVGWDEYVAFEFAKVRHLYQARLGIGERSEIEWFVGPHTINGQASYEFLHRHLRWPKPSSR